MQDKSFNTPWRLFWCADAADERLLHVSEAVSSVLGMTPGALLEDPLQWNHAVLPADAAALPRPFCAAPVPQGGEDLREYRMLGADLHLYQVRDRRFRWRDPATGRMHIVGMVEGMQELRPSPDAAVEPSWEHLWVPPMPEAMPGFVSASGPDRDRDPGSDKPAAPPSRSGSVPRTPDPSRETDENDGGPPHAPEDDPGVHPGGPKRYHDDYGSPSRMSQRGHPHAVTECPP
ncbi:hypothetical protein OU995_21705 [Roseateles sp. SL47]|uniref:hypothetical protein n=1 Tax=Roseateles sp. SL47 TaxID=2995138 RepID=UPI00226FAE17|nr:hypothetical protein [Roseateles sp. SL47]WAC72151.1 hypothetical protein OU995_21705 [Roseateles sp. SL47]